MRTILFFLLGLILLSGCNQQKCSDAETRMISQTYRGLLYFCNYHGNTIGWTKPATATVTFIGSNKVSVHLATDSAGLETTLTYKTDCVIAEGEAYIIFRDNLFAQKGQYNQRPNGISFNFDDSQCAEGNYFEGWAP